MFTARRTIVTYLSILVLIACLWPMQAPAAEGVRRISKEEAKALLGKPGVVFIDARIDSAWKSSDRKIRGAVRIDTFDLEAQANAYGKDATFIVY